MTKIKRNAAPITWDLLKHGDVFVDQFGDTYVKTQSEGLSVLGIVKAVQIGGTKHYSDVPEGTIIHITTISLEN